MFGFSFSVLLLCFCLFVCFRLFAWFGWCWFVLFTMWWFAYCLNTWGWLLMVWLVWMFCWLVICCLLFRWDCLVWCLVVRFALVVLIDNWFCLRFIMLLGLFVACFIIVVYIGCCLLNVGLSLVFIIVLIVVVVLG